MTALEEKGLPAVQFEEYTCFWTGKNMASRPCLLNISLDLRRGALHGVMGKKQSGKSTLLYSILDAIPEFKGLVCKNVRRAVIVEQESKVFPGTILENITFGHGPHSARLD